MKNMKKTLVSLFIAISMMMSMIVVSASEYTTTQQAFNDLQSYETNVMHGKWKVAEESNGNKYYTTTGGIGDMLNTTANTGKGGIVKVSFDFKFTLTAGRGYVSLYNSGQQHNKANMVTLLYKDEGVMRCAGNGMFTPTLHEWYTEEAYIDLDNREVDVVVYNKATEEAVASLNKKLELSSAEHSGWSNAGENSFEYFLFAANSDSGKGVVDLDNFKVEKFYNTELQALTDLQNVAPGTMSGKWTVVEESNGNKYYSTTGGYNDMLNAPANTGAGGLVKASFDFKFTLTAGRGYVSLYNSGQQHNKANMLTLLYKNEGQARCAGFAMFNPTLHEWYTEEAVIDLTNKKIRAVIYNKATGEIVATLDKQLELSDAEHTGWSNAGENSFEYFLFGANSDGGKGVVDLDNLKVERYSNLTEIPKDTTPIEKTLYSNDVEGGKTLHSGGTTVVVDPTDATNTSAKYNGGWYGAGLDLSEKVKSGIVEVEFDYMTNATGSSFHLNLAGSERSGKNLLTLIRRSGTTMEGAAGVYGTFETGKWYTINTVINFDTKHYMTAVIDKATGRVLKSVDTTLEPTTAEYSGWPAEINEFTMLFFSGGSADEYLDNVLVKTLLEEPAPMPETPEPEEPEVNKNVLYSNNYEKASGTDNYIINTAADGNKYLTIKARWWALQNKFENVSKNKIKVKFDFMNTASGSSFYAALADSSVSTSDGTEQLVLIRDEAKMECYSSTQNRNILGNHIENEWLTYEAIIDINTKHCISTVYNKASGDAIATVEVTLEATDGNLADWPKTATGFDTFLIQTGRGEGTHIDNLVIEKVVDAPTVSASKITVKDSLGAVQNVWTDVSPLMKTIEIDFATIMDDATVTENEIYVTKKGSETPLEATVSCADGVAVWTLADTEKLDRATEYVLHISADVANEIGETLGEDVTYSFTTNKGMVSAVMNAPKVGENAVTGFANLTAGDLIKVPVTYVNTTGEAKDLYFVVAYYKSGFKTLVDVEFIKTPFVGTITNGEYDFEHTFKKVDGADSMRFMMWDGFDTLVPLSASVSIK